MKFRQITFLFLLIISLRNSVAQVNYINNGSFEDQYHCSGVLIDGIKYWTSTDSICNYPLARWSYCNGWVPNQGNTVYQLPRTGNTFVGSTFYYTSIYASRAYFRNRLKSNLQAGKTYCAKFYVNIMNMSSFGNDGFGIYFGNSSIDTITKCSVPLTYLTPQVKCPSGFPISDTLGWTVVMGTFTATGTEKYALIGIFAPNGAIDTVVTNASINFSFTDAVIDDVSCIDISLAANAGPDKNIFLGDSAYIGIPPEVGLDNIWTSGSFTVGTGAGIWVKPTSPGTYSYVVTQDICGIIKTDTVNVNISPSLISEHTMFSQSIGLFPQPANDVVKVTFRNYSEEKVFIELLDTNGKIVFSKDEYLKNNSTTIPVDNLSDGIYYLKIKNSKEQLATKKLTVTH